MKRRSRDFTSVEVVKKREGDGRIRKKRLHDDLSNKKNGEKVSDSTLATHPLGKKKLQPSETHRRKTSSNSLHNGPKMRQFGEQTSGKRGVSGENDSVRRGRGGFQHSAVRRGPREGRCSWASGGKGSVKKAADQKEKGEVSEPAGLRRKKGF